MATILIDPDSGRRCDAACYNAKRLGCHCICGGKNHGKGFAHAMGEGPATEQHLDFKGDGKTILCYICGEVNFPDAVVCVNCGTDLEDTDA
jgi:hypothetical protein